MTRRPAPPDASAPASLDTHLLLNSLSRIAAQVYAATQRESEEVYALSDYLTLGLRLIGQGPVSSTDEAQLLEHYADLLKVCKFTGLETDIAVLATDLTMAPHSSCNALTLMLQSNRTDVRQTVQLRAVFDKRKVRLQLTPVELRGLPGEIMPGLQSALQGKCPGWTVTYSADRALLAEWAP